MDTFSNLLYQYEADIAEEESNKNIGKRIRTIRTVKGLSQGELGELVGLNADRIQKYENGARKPRFDMLKQIANALEVNVLSLTEPSTASYVDVMFILFDLENNYGFKIDEQNGKLIFNLEDANPLLKKSIHEWYEQNQQTLLELGLAENNERKAEILNKYRLWEWSFPQGLFDKPEKESQKAKIRSQIEKLQAELLKLENE